MTDASGDLEREVWLERVEQHPHVVLIRSVGNALAHPKISTPASISTPANTSTPASLPPVASPPEASSIGRRRQLSAAVRQPLDAAPLSESVYPGDTVAISIGPGIPDAADWLAALAAELLELGIRPADVSVFGMRRPATASNPSAVSVEAPALAELHWVEHQADDPQSLAMVGVSRHDHPIYVNRWLAEADVVLPMVLINSEEALTLAGSIYPSLSSIETQERLQQQEPEQQEESIEAENLVCPFLMVGIIPAPSGQGSEVVAGRRAVVQEHARQRLRELWTTTPAQHPAVLASIEATTSVGLWDRLHQALQNALTLANSQAPIVLLIADPAATANFALGHTNKKRSAPRRRFLELVEEVTRTRPVFLASNLDNSDVEDCGLGAISHWEELHRILERSPAVAWLRDADRWSIEA